MRTAVDLVITGGTIVDGTGAAPYAGDVAIDRGVIFEIGDLSVHGRTEVDARGAIVTPGFVDLHTHYDGQAIWSDRLDPSSSHGVTTAVIGNCGVGFAPCRPGDHELLVRVMEGVEDIPGVVMAEGLDWSWTTFPEYLDALDARPHDIDIGVYLPHSPLRIYVMGERGAAREAATGEDLKAMRLLAKEAMDAGALGFATSRVSIHRTADGDQIPSYNAALDELVEIGKGLADSGSGLIQLVCEIVQDGWKPEIDRLRTLAGETGRPITFTFGIGNEGPPIWRDALMQLADARAEGATITGQVFPRPVGLVTGYDLSANPFCLCPSYEEIADLPLDLRIIELRRPERRAKILCEHPREGHPLALMARKYGWMFPLGSPPNYEPSLDSSVLRRATAAGISPEEWAYDYLLGNDGNAKLLVALGNYPNGSLDALVELLSDANVVLGLGDGGAHYGMICDASYPTFLLTHMISQRDGPRLSLASAVRLLCAAPAEIIGLHDRGVLKPGYKADLNIIDLDRLELLAPETKRDLPGGGRRLDQGARGFRATIVSGTIIRRDDKPTDALPGALIRGVRERPEIQ
jgi:N-acyl-D-amino-acid deacylase